MRNCFTFDNDCFLRYQINNEVGSVLEAEPYGSSTKLKLRSKSGNILSEVTIRGSGGPGGGATLISAILDKTTEQIVFTFDDGTVVNCDLEDIFDLIDTKTDTPALTRATLDEDNQRLVFTFEDQSKINCNLDDLYHLINSKTNTPALSSAVLDSNNERIVFTFEDSSRIICNLADLFSLINQKPEITWADITGNITDNTALNSALTGINNNISSLSATVSGLSSDVSSLSTTVSGVRTDLNTLGSTVNRIDSDVSNLNTSVSGLNTRVTDVEGSVASLTTAVAELGSDVSNLDTKVSGVTTTVAELSNTVSGLSTTVSGLNTEVQGVKGDITTINSSITSLGSSITSLATNKQDKLVSGSNIKTVGGQSLLGSGNVALKSVAGQSIVGSGNIAFKSVNGNTITGSGNIVIDDSDTIYYKESKLTEVEIGSLSVGTQLKDKSIEEIITLMVTTPPPPPTEYKEIYATAIPIGAQITTFTDTGVVTYSDGTTTGTRTPDADSGEGYIPGEVKFYDTYGEERYLYTDLSNRIGVFLTKTQLRNIKYMNASAMSMFDHSTLEINDDGNILTYHVYSTRGEELSVGQCEFELVSR